MYKSKILNVFLLSIFAASATYALEVSTDTTQTKASTKTKKKKPKTSKHAFGASIETGLGYDSNPYLTPNVSYFDLTNTGGGALIEPNVQGGFFIPIKLNADYEYRLKKDIRLIADAKFDGKYFTDANLKNADQYKTEAAAGVRFRFNKYKKETNHLEMKALAGNVDKVYVDHDDGTLKLTGTALNDQSNRYKYRQVGAEVKYVYDFKKIDFLVRARYEDRDYEEPATWSSLDHKYSKVKIQGGYQFTKAFHLGAYYEYALRDYRERKSYQINPDGTISLVNPGVKFTYHSVKAYADYKISKAYKMSLDYLLTSRVDDNQGYSDYLYHSITFSNNYKISKDLRAYLDLNYYLYDYTNAYAYDTDITLPRKEAEGYDISLRTKYRISADLSTKIELSFHDASSEDKRYNYDEMIAMATLKYTF